MLGCPNEAQDATQQVFANAYRDLKQSDKELDVKPWLYAIARNHCISALRSRRPEPAEVEDVRSAPGADHHAESRQGVQDLLQDVGALPERQRAAVVMATLGGFSHGEIATAIGCENEQVKAILFQARAALSERAEAREVSCSEIREQLRVLRGGSLRRNRIRLHLEACESCRSYREAVRRERLATSGAVAVTPLAWSTGLAKSLLAKVSITGAGLREQGVAQLAAVALATGAGVVGVATVAPDTNASPSPTSITPSVPHVESPSVEPSWPKAPNVAPVLDRPAEPADGSGGGSLSVLLSDLLGEQGLNLAVLLGEDGLLDLSGVLEVIDDGAILDLGAQRKAPHAVAKSGGSSSDGGATGGGGGTHSQRASGSDGGSHQRSASNRGADNHHRGLGSLFGGGCHEHDRD